MLRVSPKGVEYSTSGGRSWMTRYSGSSCGTFVDLLPYGNELIAVTSKGIYYSTSQGRSWMSRYTGSSCGEFRSLAEGGQIADKENAFLACDGIEYPYGKKLPLWLFGLTY